MTTRLLFALRKPLAALLIASTAGGHAYALPAATLTGGGTRAYDQVLARVPADQAPLPAVAMARVMIILHRARKLASQTLCNGDWPAGGKAVQQIGPLEVTAASGAREWLYQSLREPPPLPCGQVTRAQFFQEMSRHLPAWITIRAAGRAERFRQGAVIAPRDDSAFARR